MSGIETGIAAKLLAMAVKPAIEAVQKQVGRRGAAQITSKVDLPAGPEFDEALKLLTDDPVSLGSFVAHHAKRVLSDVPSVLNDRDVRIWMQRDDVQSWVIAGVRHVIAGQSFDNDRASAASSFEQVFSEDSWWGAFVFDAAVAFVALSIKSKLSVGDRAILDNNALHAAQLHNRLDDIQGVLRNGIPQAADAVRALVEPQVRRAERFRSLVDDKRVERLVSLCERVTSGDLGAAEADVRISLFRSAAAALARTSRPEEAEMWLEYARQAGANDLAPDEARIALNREDFDKVFALIGQREDSASVMLVADALKRRDGIDAGLEYLNERLASDASGFAVATKADWLARSGRWDEAEELLGGATQSQIEENPTVLYFRMRVRLSMMLPEAERLELFASDNALPPPIKLRTDAEGRRLCLAALSDLAEFRTYVVDAEIDNWSWFDAQRLFLELTDKSSQRHDEAVKEVQRLCTVPETSILFAWLATAWGIKFDPECAKRELARKEVFSQLAGHDLLAALQLALRNDPPSEIVAFVQRHETGLLASDMPLQVVVGLRVEITAKTGRIDHARAILAEWQDRLGESATARLNAVIAEIEEGAPPLELWQRTFELTDDVADLANLIDAMIDTNHEQLGASAIELWRRRHRVDEAILSANALFNAGRDDELDALLSEIGIAGDGDDEILRHRAYALYRSGSLAEARDLTRSLRAKRPDDSGLRQLEINIALEAGRWRELGPLAQQDFERRDDRDALQLLQGAEFAQIIDDPIAEELARAAVAKEPDDPEVLLAAFGFAVRRGTDWGTEAGGWLQSAAQKSDENGPVKMGSLPDFVRMSKEGRERTVKLDRMLVTGQLPLEFAAKPLGSTISELVLDRLERNSEVRDARLRICIPLIAGNRMPSEIEGFDAIGFDLAALLALELVGLLDTTLVAFQKIHLAAGTMPQLFADYMRAQRGQRSRAAQAERLKALFTAGKISISKLADAGGEEPQELLLAQSVAALYVHAFPIHEPGSLGERVLDVSNYEAIIVSPTNVIDALERAGEISLSIARAARAMLGDEEKRWPSEIEIDFGRPLLLHIVALNALESAGVLDRLIATGAELTVSDDCVSAIDREIQEWQRAQEPLRAIERIRDKLVAAAETGNASYGGFRRNGQEFELDDDFGQSQLIALLSDASEYDALVSAERSINKLGQLTDRKGQHRPIFTILDVIDALLRKELIDEIRKSEALQKLRECGVAFVPVHANQIVAAAAEGNWNNGPPRSLRAIVASVHLPLQRDALLLPDEMYWIANVLASFARAIKLCWCELPEDRAEQAATWLLKAMPDIRAAIENAETAELRQWADNTRVTLHGMLAQPIEVPPERLDNYEEWYASLVAPQLGGRDRQLKNAIEDMLVSVIGEAGAVDIGEAEKVSEAEVRRWLLRKVPPPMREVLLENETLQAALGLRRGSLRVQGHLVLREDLFPFLKGIVDGQSIELRDQSGEIIAKADGQDNKGGACAKFSAGRVTFDFAGLLHSDPKVRAKTSRKLQSTATLSTADTWALANQIKEGPLEFDQLHAVLMALSRSPEMWASTLAKKHDTLTFFDLSEADPLYYEVFFDIRSSATLSEAFAEMIEKRKACGDTFGAAKALAPLAVSPNFDITALTSDLSDSKIADLSLALLKAGDPFSGVAAFRLAASRPNSAACLKVGTRVLKSLFSEKGSLHQMAQDYVAIAMIVTGQADISGLLSDVPLPFRRCLLLAHAGVAMRGLKGLDIKRPAFLEAVEQWIGDSYRLAGVVERANCRWWVRDWLRPAVIAAQIKAQLKALIRSVPNDLRPEQWADYIETDPEAVPDLLEFATPPLDEFSDAWVTQFFPISVFEKALAGADDQQANNALFNILLSLEEPENPDRAREIVVDLVRKGDGEAGAMSIHLAILASMRWGDLELGEAAYKIGVERGLSSAWSRPTLGEWAIAATACISDSNDRLTAMERNLRALIDRKLEPREAREWVSFLDKLCDLIPDAKWISGLRTNALLAA